MTLRYVLTHDVRQWGVVSERVVAGPGGGWGLITLETTVDTKVSKGTFDSIAVSRVHPNVVAVLGAKQVQHAVKLTAHEVVIALIANKVAGHSGTVAVSELLQPAIAVAASDNPEGKKDPAEITSEQVSLMLNAASSLEPWTNS